VVRKFTEKKLVIASHNQGKIGEITELLKPYGVEVVAGPEFDLEEPEETGKTFIENAEIKSRYFAKATGLPSLSDDSGLSVDALDGAPGIYSARWGGPEKNFDLAMKKVENALLEKVGEADGQTAHFVCAMSLCWPDGYVENFEGKCLGNLTFPPRGDGGFGYDASFIPEGYEETFAEIDLLEKQKLSHRAISLEKMVNACFR
jgi:XTP/dITP diphosphohydrolase